MSTSIYGFDSTSLLEHNGLLYVRLSGVGETPYTAALSEAVPCQIWKAWRRLVGRELSDAVHSFLRESGRRVLVIELDDPGRFDVMAIIPEGFDEYAFECLEIHRLHIAEEWQGALAAAAADLWPDWPQRLAVALAMRSKRAPSAEA